MGSSTPRIPIACFVLVSISLCVAVAQALQFEFSPATNKKRNPGYGFSLIVPDDPLYNGTNAAYDQDGAVWLTPLPSSGAETLNFSKSFNVGRFIYSEPLSVLSSIENRTAVASFSTSFELQIITTGPYGECGDGMAFFMTGQPAIPVNSTGALLGLASGAGSFSEQVARHLFAIEFDTNRNPDVDDPNASHVGIDINSLSSEVNTNDTISLASSPLYLYHNSSFFAWIEYNSSTHLITVFMTNDTISKQKPVIPLLQYQIDLSTIFNDYMYVGFSASTGRALYQAHALYFWNFSMETNPGPSPSGSKTINGRDAASPAQIAPTDSAKAACHPFYNCQPAKLVLPIVLSFSSFVALCTFAGLYYKHRRGMVKVGSHKLRRDASVIDSSVYRYSYTQIKKATKGFHDNQLVGQGAFSRVYKGTLHVNGAPTTVAVKKLNEGLGEEDAFPSEIKIISSIRHRNLLQLHGWSYHKGKALLVYQYMRHGSLDQHLYGAKSDVGLGSDTRYNILLGVAAALEYLHEGLGECVLHRDVKAANVLLNEDMEPLLGDFGLARLISHDKIVTMTAAGTPGYLAPEVFFTGKATEKADVYSFGVLALEIACGRRVLDYNLQPQEMNLIEWTWLLQQSHKIMDALDPRLASSLCSKGRSSRTMSMLLSQNCLYQIKDDLELWKCVLHLGLICSHPLPNSRPTMRHVHNVLKEGIVLPLPATRPEFPYSISIPMKSQSFCSKSSMHSNGTMSFSVKALGRSPSNLSSNVSLVSGRTPSNVSSSLSFRFG